MTRTAALYLRVSTDRQTAENQVDEVTRLAVARGYEPVVYEEVESAAKARPVLDRMLADVRTGRVHAVAVWALDRLHRSRSGKDGSTPAARCDRSWSPSSGGWRSRNGRGSSREPRPVWSVPVGRGSASDAHLRPPSSFMPPGTSWQQERPSPRLPGERGYLVRRCNDS